MQERDIIAALNSNAHPILEATISAHGTHKIMIHQTQKDALTGKLRHIDFNQINMNVKIDSMLSVHYSGDPVGVKEGGILQVETYEVKVRCMPDKLPSKIELDISGLGIDDHLLVSDINLGEEIEVLSDPTGVLITILGAQKLEPEVVVVESESEETEKADKAEKNR